MLLRIVQIAAVLVFIAVMVAINRGANWVIDMGGPGFVNGLLVGMAFMGIIMGFASWWDRRSLTKGD